MLELPETLTTNDLMRLPRLRRGWRRKKRVLTYQDYRDSLEVRLLAQKPKGWKPLSTYRVDAELRVGGYRDPLELGYTLKAHMDAAISAGLVEDDGYHNLLAHELRQRVVPKDQRGLTLTITEMPPRRRG